MLGSMRSGRETPLSRHCIQITLPAPLFIASANRLACPDIPVESSGERISKESSEPTPSSSSAALARAPTRARGGDTESCERAICGRAVPNAGLPLWLPPLLFRTAVARTGQ
jgi:hypothetical protein